MKICILGNAQSVHNQKWCESIADLGHEVVLVTLHKAVRIPGVKVVSFHSVWSRYLDLAFRIKKRKITKLVREFKPDILHGQFLSDYGYYAAKLNYHPLVVTAWGSDILVYPWMKPVFKKRIEFLLEKAEKVTVEADYLAKMLVRKFNISGRKIAVFSWGIKLNDFSKGNKKMEAALRKKYNISSGWKMVFSPRSLTPVYGINEIVSVVPKVLKRKPHTVFIFAKGYFDSVYAGIVKAKIAKLGIGKNVRILDGVVSSKEMAALFRTSEVFISAPSSDAISISVLEGMASGSIPLLNGIEANRELVTEGVNGFIFAVEDLRDLEKKLLLALNLSPGRKKLWKAKNAFLVKQKYTLEKTMKKLNKIYFELAVPK